jgi:RNA polymerase sigma-70 factor (ECF subfamily)
MLYEFDQQQLASFTAGKDLTDEQLMGRIQAKDDQALATLYRRHTPILRTVIGRVVNNDCDVDDLLQEVFLELWNRSEHYDEKKGKALGWIVTLARRRAIDRVRRRSAYRRATERFEWQAKHEKTTTMEDHTVDHDADIADLRQYLEQIVHRLPPFQKDAIELAFFRGLSQREIAAQTHLPLGTVKTRIELGLRKLTAAMAAYRDKID